MRDDVTTVIQPDGTEEMVTRGIVQLSVGTTVRFHVRNTGPWAGLWVIVGSTLYVRDEHSSWLVHDVRPATHRTPPAPVSEERGTDHAE